MKQTISKSQLKPHVLEYLRKVREEKKQLIITHFGEPVVKIIPYTRDEDNNEEKILKKLRNTIVKYKDPTKPVGEEDWEVLQ